ncbi:Uma2 family endonuclease [Streptomyces sp. NRRL F-5135]|uniref:Uma2 family endonuclease n=1 Tax=Streptomyces sp. NRRL F-5135 TaxID=1463858 RepID=UPI0004CBBF25|nr:Uma2 family endonuclease [Streptomyces sp. NRRL F-5135]
MTAAMVENHQSLERRSWDYLLETWRGLDVPEGWRAEIDEGQIVLVPPPHAHHNGVAAKVHRGLFKCLPDDLEIYQTLGIHIAPLDRLYVPDVVVVPSRLVDEADPDGNDPVDASEALLVAEITSKSNARDDRTKKYRAYARASVPVYLLIDRFDTRGPTVTVFTEPGDGTYKHSESVPFGKPFALPEPFGTTIPTADFPA